MSYFSCFGVGRNGAPLLFLHTTAFLFFPARTGMSHLIGILENVSSITIFSARPDGGYPRGPDRPGIACKADLPLAIDHGIVGIVLAEEGRMGVLVQSYDQVTAFDEPPTDLLEG